jgi:hypothetical protein
MDDQAKLIVEKAIGQAFDAWAAQHPSLAGVIDRLELSDRTVDRLRNTPEYKAAEEEYVQARIEADFLNKVLDLAKQVLPLLLAL